MQNDAFVYREGVKVCEHGVRIWYMQVKQPSHMSEMKQRHRAVSMGKTSFAVLFCSENILFFYHSRPINIHE